VIAIMNMILHGIEAPNIIHTNTLAENLADIQEKDRYDVVLANPPFGGKERKEVQQNFPIRTGETAFLFLQHFIKSLKAGGRGGIVIKNTFLSNTDNASVSLRKLLLESCNLHTVLDCPGGTFQGAGVKTVVLFFEKGAPTRKVWYYQLDPGRNLGKTNPLNDDDLKEFIEAAKDLSRLAQVWSVDVKSIDQKTFDLSVKNPNGGEEVMHRSPQEIMQEAHGAIMKGLNSAIVRSLPVPVPPLAEQQQIVGKLEEAFDGLAIATANAERNLRNARALFESHLESVFTRRGDSPVVPIGDVAEVFDGPHATPKTVDAGPVFLGISALQDGKINLGETRHVTLQDFRQWTRRVKPQSDDVVFSYETRLGQAAIIPEGLECCLGRRMGLVRVNRKRVDPRFFVYQYISPPFRKFVDSKTVRGATVDRIALKEFPSFPISLPSLSEQERMTNRLDKLRAETQRLESICRQKLAALGELKKSLLHQAFSGQL
jgi:hypothetical protein